MTSRFEVPVAITRSDGWRDQAACRDADPDLFFPDRGYADVSEAMTICNGCPVREECLDWALKVNEDEGVWGGTTPDQRRVLRKRVPKNRRAA
jgi:WhiB family transcriptional regulator, redox-sensing transcriptional regulator